MTTRHDHWFTKTLAFLPSVLCLLAPGLAGAVETDNYLGWTRAPLADSTEKMNAFVNQTVLGAVRDLEAAHPDDVGCYDIVNEALGRFTKNFGVATAFEAWALDESGMDMFPPADWSRFKTLDATIYADATSYLVVHFGNTFNINGIQVGVDKLGHFMSQGLEYYNNYYKAESEGVFDDDEPVLAAINNGIEQELGYYGYKISGVFSYADLEANYNGFRLAQNLCAGRNPYLHLENGHWKMLRSIDVRDYINPNWDESFNTSHFDESRWQTVKPRLLKYCPYLRTPHVQALMADYRARVTDSFSMTYLKRLIREGKLQDPAPQRLDAICP